MEQTASSTLRKWPVQKRSQERLERVLRVAEGLIVERGFANLNMNELSEIAKVNISTIYTYFPNSKSLLRVLALRQIEEVAITTRSLFDGLTKFSSPEEMVDRLIDTVIGFYRARPSFNAIWRGMQSDNELLALDIEDTRVVARALVPLLEKINPSLSNDVEMTALILIAINGGVVRLAAELSVREREAAYHQLHVLTRRMLIF